MTLQPTVTLYHGDCLEIMRGIPDGSVDAVVTDPPYFRVSDAAWDKAWKSREKWLAWLEECVVELKRVLSPNGSLLVFCDDENAAYVQVMIDRHLTFLNNIVWFKTNNMPIKAAQNLRKFAPMTERILFHTPQLCKTGLETVKLDLNNFVGLRAYFKAYQDAIGLSIKQINEALGHRRAEHAFYWGSTQWELPTPDVYAELGNRFPTNGFLRREYEDLRREYEDLRRPFNADPRTLDVISGPIVTQGDNTGHPTTKPLWIMQRLVTTVTKPGDTVLDPFMGSGTTGVACVQTGRNFIGIEIDRGYFEIAQRRIEQAQQQPRLLEVE